MAKHVKYTHKNSDSVTHDKYYFLIRFYTIHVFDDIAATTSEISSWIQLETFYDCPDFCSHLKSRVFGTRKNEWEGGAMSLDF